MITRAAFLSCGGLLALGAGCTLISGIDAFETAYTTQDAGALPIEGAPRPADATADANGGVLDPLPVCGENHVCAAVPSGWSLVAAGQVSDAGCADGYADAETVTEKPLVAPPAVCGCSCGTGQGSCSGPIAFTVGLGSCNILAANVPPNGTCARFANVSGGVSGRAAPPAPVEQACPGSPRTEQLPPAQPVRTQLCHAVATTGGCSESRLCVREPAGSDPLCITSVDSAAECPADYPNRRAIGDGLDDKRGCGACACETRSRCDATFQVSTSSSCSSGNRQFTADGVCRALPSSASDYIGASGTTTVRSDPCVVKTPSAPTGDIGLTHPRVLCCR